MVLRIENIDVPLYSPDDPYHWVYDNLPLQNMVLREQLIAAALNDLTDQLTNVAGTQGTLANRLNQSIASDGSLLTAAVDDTSHSMEFHTDDFFGTEIEYAAWEQNREAPFVRMMKSEADKLNGIAESATNFQLSVETPTTTVSFPADNQQAVTVEFVPSQTVTWEVDAPNKVKANFGFPVETAHIHNYDQVPVPVNQMNPDYLNYQVNSAELETARAFISGSLRVYVNGMRLSAHHSVYVPGALVSDPWTLLSYTANAIAGTFSLSSAITEEDVITIDYDILPA